MIWLGMPSGVTDLWAAYVGGVRRRFRLGGLLGEELVATTGFPEGYGLSVVAMVVTGLALANSVDSVLQQCEASGVPMETKLDTFAFADHFEACCTNTSALQLVGGADRLLL